MSANRYPDNSRYTRDRSPPYRDRRPSTFGGSTYPPRGSESSSRPNPDSSGFPPRDTPRGPKSLGDAPRGPAPGPPSGAPPAPRDGRGRGFTGRGDDTPLRNAPPLSSGPAAPSHNTHSSWRADRDRDRDRDFDRRERRPTPPRRSPIRDSRDPRDQRDFAPRDLDVGRARRNSRDGGPPSAGSNYSDPPLGAGSTYRGSGVGRGRGGRDFAGRGRPFHPDERDRHHDSRDRTWRPRSRSPPPIRRDRDPRDDRRDDRDLDRRDRDDRRFPREYDSYIGPAGAAKAGPRALDTHRGPTTSDSRYLPGTPTGPTPHSSHHASPSDRLGPQTDSYSRRSSVAVDSTAAKDARREPGKDEALLASRAEASRERYAPRASSPPAAVPAFGSNVWRAPTTESKPSTAAPAVPKPAAPVTAPAPTTAAPVVTPTTPSVPVAPPVSSAAPTPAAATTASVPPAPKPPVPAGLNVAPPTGPKADRVPDRPLGDAVHAESKAIPVGPSKPETPADSGANAPAVVDKVAGTEKVEPKAPTAQTAPVPTVTPVTNPPSSTPSAPSAPSAPSVPSGPSASSAPAKSPPQGPAPKPRQPPTAPQAALRANTSPQFSRAPFPPYTARDPSPSIAASSAGPRTGNASTTATVNTSPKSLPANIPTGPKADRTPMAPRAPPMYPPSDRLHFSAPRAPISGGPKSMQWVRPGLIPGRPAIPSKREFPAEDRDRAFGTAPKAPKLENSASTIQPPRGPQAASDATFSKTLQVERPKERAASAERPVTAPSKPTMIETRRHSDVFMADASPRLSRPPMSATSSAPEALEDSEDEVDLDEDDFADIEAKYNRERELLEAKRIDLSAPHLRATTPLHEIYLMNCITVDHLHSTSQVPEPELEPESISEAEPMIIEEPVLTANGPPVSDTQKPLARSAAELLTPKNDLPDDVDMEEKEDKSPAPATVALRLRKGVSLEPDSMPDLSSLPYLGSGPPTPLSDIEQVRPKLSDDVMSAIRDKLRKSIEPELTTEQILQQYANVYRQWRMHIRPMDEERDIEDQERQPSAEPSLKATTPDVSTASMPGLLDMPLTVSGRRGHSSRWATELDLEQAIKESLKTAAEEERIGKTDREPRRAMADPEKEAELPLELNDSEAQRRRYRDTNFQREPGQGIFVFHYEPPEDDFTPEEHRVMVQNYRDQYAKKWGKLAEILYKEVGTERTYKDCINHYYSTKWGREYKGKVKGRRGGPRKRGGGVGRGRGAIANMDRPEITGEDGAAPQVTETGRPRRSAAPKFGELEADIDPASGTPTPGGRARRQTDADSTQERTGKRGKVAKEKGSRKAKQMQLAAAAPTGSPVKLDRKEKMPGVKSEDDLNKRTLGDMQVPLPIPVNPAYIEDQMLVSSDGIPPMSLGFMERPKTQANTRPGPSSYWSVSELQDFDKNVAHFGTDWVAIANHMGSKTHTMIKNQYLRLLENGRVDLEQAAKEADGRRERGDNLGPPPTPTPAPKRRYESTQTAIPRQLAPTPELTKSPLLSAIAMQKTTPPHSGAPSRFSAIAQAPMPGKPLAATAAFPSIPETSLASIPSLSQQSPPGGPSQRPQIQHQHQHTLSQSKPQYPPPRAGQFSEEPSRHDGRSPQQLSQPGSRVSQHVPPTMRLQEQHPTSSYRTFGHHERETAIRQEAQQEHESQQRYQHARRVSQHEAQRHFSAGSVPPLAPPARSNSGARSPERPPTFTHSHSRHPSQTHAFAPAAPEVHQQGHNVHLGTQQVPQRSLPVKEEPRNSPAPSVVPPAQNPPQGLHQHSQYGQPPMQNIPAPPVSKPAAEPRKSNLMSLLNDTDQEEPKRKKPSDQGPPSHSTTPSQQNPIAPPPPTSQALPARRGIYDDPYGRPSYSQQASVPPANPNRAIDLTAEQSSTSRSVARDGWPPRQQQYMPAQNQAPQQTPGSSHSNLPQPPFGDSNLYRHRSVFATHNDPRHNPSPPPLGAYNNSPHMQSRTPSISGAPTGPPRHGVPSTSAGHHPGTPGASAHILQPNPYAQVDPPGSAAPPNGPMGMRPSPHLHTNHIVQQRDMHGRNEQSQAQNAGLPYSNPQTPIEHPSHQPPRGPSGMADPYRPRDPRDSHHEYQSRHMSDRDTSREISQRADNMLREHLSSSMRSTPLHDDLRYQPQHHDRSYLTQRSHTPLSRPDPSQPAPLQHPPQSALGTNNHAAWSQQQRPTEDTLHRPPYQSYNPRDRSMTDRIREEQAAAMNRDDHLRREDERQMRENLLRGSMRGLPPGASTPGAPGGQQPPDQRPGHSAAGSMDWTSGVARHPQESWRR